MHLSCCGTTTLGLGCRRWRRSIFLSPCRLANRAEPDEELCSGFVSGSRTFGFASDKMSFVSPRFSRLIFPSSALLVIAVLLFLPACGQFFPSADQIVALTLSPLNSVVLPNGTQQYAATATFGNNTTGDATDTVTWSSSVSNIATVSTTGLATAGTTLGSTTISAKSGSVIATTGLTVSNQTVTSITVSPATVTIVSGSTQQLTATAALSNNGTQDVTSAATWSSSNTSIATVTGGLVTGVSTGTVTVSATYGGQTGTASVTVQ
jgi:Bacterial Ig-like domain (group 2)